LPVVVAVRGSAGVTGTMVFHAELDATIREEVVGAVAVVHVQGARRAMPQGHADATLSGLCLGAQAVGAGGFEDRSFLLVHFGKKDLVRLQVRPLDASA